MRLFNVSIWAMMVMVMISCQQQSVEAEKEVNQEIDPSKGLEQILQDVDKGFEVPTKDGEMRVAAEFALTVKDGKYVAKEIDYMSQDMLDFSTGMMGRVDPIEEGTIFVHCGDKITRCNEKSYFCIGRAIRDCLDAGGCANVCEAKVLVVK